MDDASPRIDSGISPATPPPTNLPLSPRAPNPGFGEKPSSSFIRVNFKHELNVADVAGSSC